MLRDPGDSRVLFYAVIGLGLLAALRLSRKLVAVLVGLVVFGFLLRLILGAIHDDWVNGTSASGGHLAKIAGDWVVVPVQPASWIAPVSYVTLVACCLLLTVLRGWVRLVVLVPVLYLAAFVWENVMLAKPEPARSIVLGVILIALMILRPNGLLGERRVEIV